MFPYDWFDVDDDGVVASIIDNDLQGVTFSVKKIKMLEGG
jgi:hypothetical protein